MRITIRLFCVLVLFSVLLSSAAFAATVSLPQNIATGYGSTRWDISNNGDNGTGPFGSGGYGSLPGLVINEATSASNASDAFDNAYQIYVNGTIVSSSTADLTGTTLTVGPLSMAVDVTVQYHFFTDKSLGRIMAFLHNPTGSPVDVTVQVPVNFGSDSGTILRDTSSGDLIVTTEDRWIVTSDSGPSDPVNTTVMYGLGASVIPTSYTELVCNCSARNGLGATFNVSVPAGATRSLMFFAGLGDITGTPNTISGAINAAVALFDAVELDPSLLAGLSAEQQSDIVNWNNTTLNVIKTGTGSGTVTGDGIDCGADCSESYDEGTVVELTAIPSIGSIFAGWSGDCDSTGQVTIDGGKTCTATFNSARELVGSWNLIRKSGPDRRGIYKLAGSFNVANTGVAPANNVIVNVYLSNNDTYESGDTLLASLFYGTVGPKISRGKSFTVSTKTNPSGKYVIGVIDPSNFVIEANEANNSVPKLVP